MDIQKVYGHFCNYLVQDKAAAICWERPAPSRRRREGWTEAVMTAFAQALKQEFIDKSGNFPRDHLITCKDINVMTDVMNKVNSEYLSIDLCVSRFENGRPYPTFRPVICAEHENTYRNIGYSISKLSNVDAQEKLLLCYTTKDKKRSTTSVELEIQQVLNLFNNQQSIHVFLGNEEEADLSRVFEYRLITGS